VAKKNLHLTGDPSHKNQKTIPELTGESYFSLYPV